MLIHCRHISIFEQLFAIRQTGETGEGQFLPRFVPFALRDGLFGLLFLIPITEHHIVPACQQFPWNLLVHMLSQKSSGFTLFSSLNKLPGMRIHKLNFHEVQRRAHRLHSSFFWIIHRRSGSARTELSGAVSNSHIIYRWDDLGDLVGYFDWDGCAAAEDSWWSEINNYDNSSNINSLHVPLSDVILTSFFST